MEFDQKVIEKYLISITSGRFHRYKSWDHCYESFNGTEKRENRILQLAFYLASWGMYRGFAGLLQKNHLIHEGAVDILFDKKYRRLWCFGGKEVSADNIGEIFDLKAVLSVYYKETIRTKNDKEEKQITPTDTLISKIMLGTLGCVPAFDRYFIAGLKEMKMNYRKFNPASLNHLFNFINDNSFEIKKAQEFTKKQTEKNYPLMKIIDMYFWQIGYDKEETI
jgi:hypothetical protein